MEQNGCIFGTGGSRLRNEARVLFLLNCLKTFLGHIFDLVPRIQRREMRAPYAFVATNSYVPTPTPPPTGCI